MCAAVETDGGVAVAWDTAVTAGGWIDHGDPKAWKPRPWLGLALSGLVAAEQDIRFRWTPPTAQPADLERWVHVDLVDAWRELLGRWEVDQDEHGHAREPYVGIAALVCAGGLVWSIDGELSVHRSRRGYHAIGSGAAWAEGALWREMHAGGWPDRPDAERAAREAVLAACEHAEGLRVSDAPGGLWVPSAV